MSHFKHVIFITVSTIFPLTFHKLFTSFPLTLHWISTK